VSETTHNKDNSGLERIDEEDDYNDYTIIQVMKKKREV